MLFNNWKENLQPLIDKYKDKKHPLAYDNLYELLIMVILSAQDSDAKINKVKINFFEKYPNIVLNWLIIGLIMVFKSSIV